jgi:predicted nucleic-acid-binding protein
VEDALLIGIDTNILIRFVLEDDPMQAVQIQAFFDTFTPREPGYISLVVLCEFAWVLGRFYRRTRGDVAAVIEQVLNISALEIERAGVAQKALKQFRNSRADFGDCCIAVIAEAAGCNYTLTFDEAAAKLPGMRLLS